MNGHLLVFTARMIIVAPMINAPIPSMSFSSGSTGRKNTMIAIAISTIPVLSILCKSGLEGAPRLSGVAGVHLYFFFFFDLVAVISLASPPRKIPSPARSAPICSTLHLLSDINSIRSICIAQAERINLSEKFSDAPPRLLSKAGRVLCDN